jgi:DNA-binding response OmpR family regulator
MDSEPASTPAILIVDDIAENLNVLRHVLEPAGYRILGATSGEAALQIAARVVPSLVLLDVMMPGLDGFATCRALKQDPLTRHVPVVFVTAREDPAAVVQGFQAGGVDYVVKPFNREEVLARVQAHVQLHSLARALARRNRELEELAAQLRSRQAELEAALASIKTLRGLIPICCHCKKVRDDRGFWQQVEAYVAEHSSAQFSHGICPECMRAYYPEFPEADATGAPAQ